MPRVTVTVPDYCPQPYRFQLDRRVVTLGRGSSNDIVIDCGSISASHAEMRRIEGGYELRDLGSTNGIKLDGERMPVIPLRDGLSVTLGDVAFDFQLSDEERAALEREKPAQESPIMREPVEVAPKRPAKERAQQTYAVERPASGMGAAIMWFVILALVAFCTGMAIRYQKETGGSWLEAVKTRIFSGPADVRGK